MRDEIFAYLRTSEGPLAYVVLAIASTIEYVIPPFPGDAIALFGVFLAATAGYHPALVYLSLNLGALAGGMLAYGLGRRFARVETLPGPLGHPRVSRAIKSVVARFERHGAAYLALNRFVPALRGVFFLAAGMARVPWYQAAGYGLLSSAVWTALLLAIGWAVGDNLAYLEQLLETYTYAALALVLVLAVGFGVRAYVRHRRAAR